MIRRIVRIVRARRDRRAEDRLAHCVRCGTDMVRHIVVDRDWVAEYYTEVRLDSICAVPHFVYCPDCLVWVGGPADVTLPMVRDMSLYEAQRRAVRYAGALLDVWGSRDRAARIGARRPTLRYTRRAGAR